MNGNKLRAWQARTAWKRSRRSRASRGRVCLFVERGRRNLDARESARRATPRRAPTRAVRRGAGHRRGVDREKNGALSAAHVER